MSKPFVTVMVIGAGFSGLAMGCQLKKELKCEDLVIYDQMPKPGGTWWSNQYPGCGVDIPAVFYSLSFAPNPHFSKVFPKQDEILGYFNRVAAEHDISRHIQCNVQWEEGHWIEETSTWQVRLRDLSTGMLFQQGCKILVSAVGGLSIPKTMNFKDAEVFEGDIVHTAQWNHDVCLRDKNVVVIGNGSSASQLVPSIVDEAKKITQFMRTPQHYMPSENIPISLFLRKVFQHIPSLLWLLRAVVFAYLETSGPQFNITTKGESLRKRASETSRKYVQANAPEEYWPLLIPTFDLGCKRRVFDNDRYIPCLHRANVHLTADPIVAIQPRSVLTKSGKVYPADTIVLATGFTTAQFDAKLFGRNGLSREDHWKEFGSKSAFKTVAMANFPNFFYILGPHSGRGHTSTIFAAESFVHLVIRVIKDVVNGHTRSVEIRPSSEKSFHEHILKALDKTVYTDKCGSWYIDQKTGKNWFIYPWDSFTMWYSTHMDGMEDWVYELNPAMSRGRKNQPYYTVLMIAAIATLAWIQFATKY
ncbi:monooxygenase [Penicillium malachiteum]|nr:monooxygenase [Penicillium malachiteum]